MQIAISHFVQLTRPISNTLFSRNKLWTSMRELLREFPTARLSLFLVFNGFRPVWSCECERIYMNPIRVIISSDGYGDPFLKYSYFFSIYTENKSKLRYFILLGH